MKDVLAFLATHVNGKTLHTKPLVYGLENGALEGVYSDQISFSNLQSSESGLRLDMFIVSNEKVWLLNEEKQRHTLRKDFSGVALFRYELALRQSTGALTGVFRFVSASGKGVLSEAVASGIYGVRLAGGELHMQEDQLLYRDQPVQNGRCKPVAFQAAHRFFVQGGKLHFEYSGASFDVDGETLQRKPSTDDFPPFLSVEA